MKFYAWNRFTETTGVKFEQELTFNSLETLHSNPSEKTGV